MIQYRTPFLLALVAFIAVPIYAQEKPSSIWVMKADGNEARKLIDVEGHTDQAAARWSRDGKQILFDAMDPNTRIRDLFIINADGTGLRKLGPGAQADWSPDGKQIVSDDGREIYVQNVDGQGRDKLTTGQSPRWSPDGGQIALVEDNNLHVVDIVTNERRALFAEPFQLLYDGVGWSPDGKEIVMVCHPVDGPRRQLLIVNSQGADRGVRPRISTAGGMSSTPCFSPDGKKIAYSAAYLIMIVDVEGSGRPKMLPDQKGQNFEPDWSPDGKWIAFTSDREP
jgi:Tol biopolymer transport system component